MNLKKYLTLTRAGAMETLQYRASAVVIVLGNLLYLTIVYFLWKAIYASSPSEVVNGMTFYDTLIYLVLAAALAASIEMYTVWMIGRDIQSGKIVLDLLKPMEYRSFYFWSMAGSMVMNFLMTFIPTFIAVEIMTHGAIHLGMNIVWFLIALVFAVLINYSIDFIVSTICLFTESIWGINIMKQVIIMLLSGATIPLAFFPDKLRAVVDHLPFQSIYNAPLSLLLDSTGDVRKAVTTLATQLMWCVVMTVISKLFWNVSVKQITVNGG